MKRKKKRDKKNSGWRKKFWQKKPWAILLQGNWLHLLAGIEPKDKLKQKSRRKDLLLAASKKDNKDTSQSIISPNSKTGAGAKRSQHWVQHKWMEVGRVSKGHHHHSLGSNGSGNCALERGLHSAKQLKNVLQANPDLWNGTTDILWLSSLSGLIISVQFYLLLLL